MAKDEEKSSEQRTLRLRALKKSAPEDPDKTGPTREVKAEARGEMDRARDLLALGLAEGEDADGGWSLDLGPGEGDADEDVFSAQAIHGRYLIKDLLGRGGMGEVHEVYDAVLDRHLAMKTARVDNPEMLSRFIQEARITSKLQHPNVPPVHDLGVGADGKHYFTMRRVRGKSLSALLKKDEAGTLMERLDIFRKICDAVAYAHSRGVIHRDLKPSNIMVGQFGIVLVLDWGLAKVLGDIASESMSMPAAGGSSGSGSHETRLGTVMGTPAWMAPEQALGEINSIDRCSDIFSLGAILYALLTGKPPFERRPQEILEESSSWEVSPPSEIATTRKVHQELDSVVLKAMARDPADRFESVEELRAEAQAFVEGLPLASARYSVFERIGKWASRHRTAVSAAMSVAAVALMLIAFGAWRYATDVNEARDRAVSEAERSRIAERDALARLGEASVATADALVRENRPSEAHSKLVEARELFETVDRALLPIDLRFADMAGRFIAPARQWSVGEVEALALRPDGAQVVVATAGGRASLWDLPSGARISEYDPGAQGKVVAVGWLRQEARALVSEGATLSLVAMESGETIASVADVKSGYHRISLQEGERIYLSYLSHGGDDRTWRPGDAAVRKVPWPKEFRPTAFRGNVAAGSGAILAKVVEFRDMETGDVTFSEEDWGAASFTDEAVLLSDMGGEEIVLMDLESKEVRWRAEVSNVRRSQLSSDGSHAFTVSGGGQIQAWRGEDGELIAPLSGRVSAKHRLSVGAKGARVVGVLDNGDLAFWHIGDSTRWQGLEPPASAWGIDSVEDGEVVVVSCVDGQVILFDTIAGLELARVSIGEGARDIALAPDGAHVAIAGTDGQIWIWDLESGEASPAFRADEVRASSVTFLMQGKAIASVGIGGALEIRSFPQLRQIHHIENAHQGVIWTVESSPDGNHLATTGRDEADGTIRIWDARTGKLLHTLEKEVAKSVPFHASWSRDGHRIAYVVHSGKLVAWDLRDQSTLVVQAHDGPAMGVGYSADGNMIATSGYDGAVDFWDATTLEPLASFPRSREPIVDLVLSADGNAMATTASNKQIQVWDFHEHEQRPAMIRAIEQELSKPSGGAYQARARLAEATEYWDEAAAMWEQSALAGEQVSPLDRVRALAMAGRRAEAQALLDSAPAPASQHPGLHGWRLWLRQAPGE